MFVAPQSAGRQVASLPTAGVQHVLGLCEGAECDDSRRWSPCTLDWSGCSEYSHRSTAFHSSECPYDLGHERYRCSSFLRHPSKISFARSRLPCEGPGQE